MYVLYGADQVPVADDGKVVLGPDGLGLDAVEVAGEADEPVVVLRVALRLPVGVGRHVGQSLMVINH